MFVYWITIAIMYCVLQDCRLLAPCCRSDIIKSTFPMWQIHQLTWQTGLWVMLQVNGKLLVPHSTTKQTSMCRCVPVCIPLVWCGMMWACIFDHVLPMGLHIGSGTGFPQVGVPNYPRLKIPLSGEYCPDSKLELLYCWVWCQSCMQCLVKSEHVSLWGMLPRV